MDYKNKTENFSYSVNAFSLIEIKYETELQEHIPAK